MGVDGSSSAIKIARSVNMIVEKVIHLDTKKVRCPRCGAEPGRSCVHPSGRRYFEFHKERQDIAWERLKATGKVTNELVVSA
jgi:hypothetical protein